MGPIQRQAHPVQWRAQHDEQHQARRSLEATRQRDELKDQLGKARPQRTFQTEQPKNRKYIFVLRHIECQPYLV